jgi:uncharacterized protein (TIGR00255 family)
MITSMTGFGSARATAPNLTVLVEMKSVNHRYIDIHVKIPGEYQAFENQIRQKISGSFKRGRFDVFVRIDYKREGIKLEADEALIRAYIQLVSRLKNDYPIDGGLSMEMISRLPGAVTVLGADLTAADLAQIGSKVDEAAGESIRKLAEMRVTEGKSLMRDVESRIDSIGRHLETILAKANDFVVHYREQLIARVAELAPQLAADSNRLEMEALIYAERSDVTEETTRLASHLDQFRGLKDMKDEAGKRMDFILQEMNREATTILSKTSGLNERGAEIGKAAIEIKVEIEKLREQVQNIE